MNIAWVIHRNLPVHADSRTTDQRYPLLHTSGVEGLAGLEVIAAIEDHIRLCHQALQQLRIGARLQRLHLYRWVKLGQCALGRQHFGLPNAVGAVHDLALQIRQIHGVVIDEGDAAHT